MVDEASSTRTPDEGDGRFRSSIISDSWLDSAFEELLLFGGEVDDVGLELDDIDVDGEVEAVRYMDISFEMVLRKPPY
jgi:hypothetical protein